jgi:hypothetical protein
MFSSVTLREAYLKVGSQTDSRDTFFCVAKRKYPKKRPPTYRKFLRFSLLSRVFRTGFPALRKTRGIPAAPLRAMLDKSCDARAVCKGFNSMPSAVVRFAAFCRQNQLLTQT